MDNDHDDCDDDDYNDDEVDNYLYQSHNKNIFINRNTHYNNH